MPENCWYLTVRSPFLSLAFSPLLCTSKATACCKTLTIVLKCSPRENHGNFTGCKLRKMASLETLQSASYENMRVWRKHGGAVVETWSVSLLSLPALRGWGGRRLALAPPFCLKKQQKLQICSTLRKKRF